MVNQEIFYGIKNAVENGESLQSAMMTFINSGYPQKEVQLAAGAVQSGQTPKIISPQKTKQPPEKKLPKIPEIKEQKSTKKISEYGKSKKPSKALLFIVIFLIILVFGGLVFAFLFKEQLANFLEKIF